MSLLAPLALLLGLLMRVLLPRRGVVLKGLYLPLLALGAELLGVRTGLVLFQGVNYALLFLFFLVNRHPLLLPLALGAGLNGLAVLLHGGMPVDPVALERAGLGAYRPFLEGQGDGLHFLAPAFPLGDWIVLPGRVVSPGDLFLLLGLLLLGWWGKVDGDLKAS